MVDRPGTVTFLNFQCVTALQTRSTWLTMGISLNAWKLQCFTTTKDHLKEMPDIFEPFPTGMSMVLSKMDYTPHIRRLDTSPK